MVGSSGAALPGRTRLRVAGCVAGLGIALGLAACEDGDLNFVQPISARAVTVFKDSTFNFTTLRTFAMPDTVVHFNPPTGVPLNISRQFDQVTLDRVRQNFLARGYTQVANPATTRPDFVVLVAVTATPSYNAWIGYSWFSVWGFYSGWGWFQPGFTTAWRIVYPWFGVVGTTAYEAGTLIVDLIPTSSVNVTTRTIRSAWAGVASALFNGVVDANTVDAAVDQMFALSPYLTVTP
jgi:Domain of unknown function (DUF4136)